MVKIILPISLIIVLSLAAGFYFKESFTKNLKPTLSTTPSYTPSNIPTKAPQASTSANSTKLFKSSKTMKFSIEVPSNYTVEEKFATVTITSPSKEIIHISINGSNFDNLDQYLTSLSKNNKLQFLNQERIRIDQFPAVKTTLSSPKQERIYFIYPTNSWSVYSISTNSSNLFPILDQIAQSFKYNP